VAPIVPTHIPVGGDDLDRGRGMVIRFPLPRPRKEGGAVSESGSSLRQHSTIDEMEPSRGVAES